MCRMESKSLINTLSLRFTKIIIMKNIFQKLFALTLLVSFSGMLNAQTVTIGSGVIANTNTGEPAPFQDWAKNSRHQFLIRASELTFAGIPSGATISSLGWTINSLTGSTLEENYSIYYKWTSVTVLTTTFQTGLTQVYGPTDFTPSVTGNIDFALTSSLSSWDGTSNLLIQICEGATTGVYTHNCTSPYSALGFVCTTYYRADGTSACPSVTGTTLSNRPNTRITYSSGGCTGTPTPGNTVSTSNPVCSGSSFTLSLQNSTSGSGVTYQWESSPDGSTWSNASGSSTSASYTTSQTSATYYRCQVTCSAGPSTGASNSFQVTMNGLSITCYCTANATTCDAAINAFVFNTISNTSGCSGGYANNSATSTTIEQGASYPISITTTLWYSGDQAAIWIDYDQNGVFADPAEKTSLIYSGSGGVFTGTVAVPLSATLGSTFLRARMMYTTYAGPCGGVNYGEVEDYGITIIPSTACSGTPAVGTITPASTASCGATSAVALTLNGITGSGYTYQWQDSPDNTTFTDIGGATSSTYTTGSVSTTTYYRCNVTCTSSSSTTSSSSAVVTISATPTGNTFGDPIIIGSLPYSVIGNNLASNCWTSTYSGGNAQASPDVFYMYTATCDGIASIGVCTSPSSFDTYLHWLDASGTEIVSDDDTEPTGCYTSNSSLSGLSVTAGTTYYIVVEGFSANTGTYTLTISQVDASYTFYADSDNDTYGNPLVTTTNCVNSAPTGYVSDNTDCNDTNPLVWTTYTLTVAGTALDDQCGESSGEIGLNVTDNVGAVTYLWSNLATTDTIFGLSAGTYSVTVTDAGCGTGSGTWTINTVSPAAPTGIYADNITTTQATAHWNAVGTRKYRCRRKKVGTATWTFSTVLISAPNNSWVFANMEPGSTYDWEMNAQCSSGSDSSGWVAGAQFTTNSVCAVVPTGLITPSSQLTATTAQLKWTAVTPAPTKYNIRYRIVGTTTWTTTNATGTVHAKNITGLTASSNYQWQMRCQCGLTAPVNHSNWSTMATFSTPAIRMADPGTVSESSILLFPNPASDYVTVQISSDEDFNGTIVLTDMTGRIMITQVAEITEGENDFDLNIADLSSGMYIVCIKDATGACRMNSTLSKTE